MSRLLIVTAVAAERDAILAGLAGLAGTASLASAGGVDVIVGGVGPAAAAAATSAELAARPADLVLSAGIGGGFAPLAPGELAVASAIVFADLGAETADGFAPVSTLGFGSERYDVEAALTRSLAAATGGRVGAVLTVATVTGTAARAAQLAARFPDAAAEAMEGAGVAAAAALHGVTVGELRAISNVVGPRDRDAWQIPRALDCLGRAVAAFASQRGRG